MSHDSNASQSVGFPKTQAEENSSRHGTVVVALDHHFVRVDGKVYTDLAFGSAYWQEYLECFEEVVVFARVRDAEKVPGEMFPAGSDHVAFLGLPDYLGPIGLMRALPLVLWRAYQASRLNAAFILRSGSVSTCLWPWLLVSRKTYAREVQGFVGVAIKEATRQTYRLTGPVFARIGEWLTRREVRYASAASYVSEACRAHYPTAHRRREFVFSSVQLSEELVTGPRPAESFQKNTLRVISVGRIEHEKGHHVLLEAVAQLKQQHGTRVQVTLAGGGRSIELLRRQACQSGIADQVDLLGPIQRGPSLFSLLDQADLFVLPSLTEGMPRALIEAMARGLPAIATRVGGVPEILSESQMIPPDDPDALAAALLARIDAPEQLAEHSARNFDLAVERYSPYRTREQKHAFWHAARPGLSRAA